MRQFQANFGVWTRLLTLLDDTGALNLDTRSDPVSRMSIFIPASLLEAGRFKLVCAAIALATAATASSSLARAEPFEGPHFRKGLWRFDRTLGTLDQGDPQRQQMTRCVDPTNAMKGIFASLDVGNCRSTKAERTQNGYTFANRCDYLGPVRTTITVHSEDSYTELNVSTTGAFRQVDKVVARRIGDCAASE
jgi:Protein of unknown function (DUF3617)